MRRRLTVDLGPLIWFRCPDCYESGILRLASTQPSGGSMLIRLLFPKLLTPEFAVVCEKCEWPAEIDPPERAAVEKLQELTRDFQSGRIEAQAYFARILEAAAGILEKLRIAGEHWICEKCGEDNSATFSECWSCSEPAPEGAPQLDPEPGDGLTRRNLDHDLPWEY